MQNLITYNMQEPNKNKKKTSWELQQEKVKAEKEAKLKKLLEQERPIYKKKTLDEKIAEKRQEQTTRIVEKDNTITKNYNDATKHSNAARNKTDKEIVKERKAIREKSDANVLNSWSLDAFKPSNYTRENIAEMAQGLESKFRISDEPNFFDDYLNPANMVGGMASNLGQAPLQAKQTDSYMPYVTAVGTPLAVGAMAGLGTKTTGQFVNNLANPLVGTGEIVDKLGNKYLPNAYKYNPFAFKPNPEAYYRQIFGKEAANSPIITKTMNVNNDPKGIKAFIEAKPYGFYKKNSDEIFYDLELPFTSLSSNDALPYFNKSRPYYNDNFFKGKPEETLIETNFSAKDYEDFYPGSMRIVSPDPNNEGIKRFGDVRVLSPFSKEGHNLENYNIYKKNWLKGYKEVPNPTSKFALGGNLQQQTNNNMLNEFNEGGSHEQNPLGGIPQGMGNNGVMNTVEEGETKKDNFIYSDRIKLTPELVSQFNLPKVLSNKTAAEATKIINTKFEGRNSTIDNSTKKAMLDRIAEAQETVKQIEAQKQAEIAEALNINSTMAPEDQMNGEIPQGMEEFLPQEQPQFRYEGSLPQNKMYGGGDINQMGMSMLPGIGSTVGVSNGTSNGMSNMSGGASGGAMGGLGSMFSGIGNGLNAYAQQRNASKMPEGYVDKKGQQDQMNNQLIDSTKDTVAQVFGPIGGLFRGIQKTGQGIGNSIGGDAGAAVSGIFSPEEGTMAALTDKDLSIGQKALATIPGVGGVIAKRQADKRLNKFRFEKDTLEANMKISNFAFGGNMYNDGGYLDRFKQSLREDDPNYVATGPKGSFKSPTIPNVDFKSNSMSKFRFKDLSNITNINEELPSEQYNRLNKIPEVNIGYNPNFKNRITNTDKLSTEEYQKNPSFLNKVGEFAKDNYGNILRYAPVAMNALQLHKLNKAGYDTVNPIINNTRYNPQYMDEKALVNQINAESNYAGNALANASNGSMGALRSNILASQLAKTKGLSDAYSRIAEVNRNENKTGQQFNLGVDEANIARRIVAEDKTAMNKGNWETNKSRLLGQMGTDLGNIGKEEVYKKLAKESFGYTWDGKYYVGPKGDKLTRQEMNSKIDSESNQNTTNQNRFGGYMLNGPFLNNRMIKRYK